MISSLPYTPTPVVEIETLTTKLAGVQLLLKREDLNHPQVSGNKWWKLKNNLQEANETHHRTVLTFGGAYSNHIYATAAGASLLGLKSIGIIRGEETLPLNTTLIFARQCGMELHYISREKYRLKTETAFIDELKNRFGNFYMIPEGGTNEQAVKGCAEFGQSVLSPISFDHLLLPVGTGGTIAGIVCGLEGKRNVTGVSVLKNGSFLMKEINDLISNFSKQDYGNWNILTSYDHGGYAKVTKELLDFVKAMKSEHNLPFDQVYTGKLMYAAMREIEAGNFRRGSTVLVLHTGGLQGSNMSIKATS